MNSFLTNCCGASARRRVCSSVVLTIQELEPVLQHEGEALPDGGRGGGRTRVCGGRRKHDESFQICRMLQPCRR